MINMANKKYGKLLALSLHHIDKRGKTYWLCKCDCGKETVADGYKIRKGITTSCGCVQANWRKTGPNHSHGLTNSRLYSIWSNIKARCNNPKNYEFKYYGGKGVCICQEWTDFSAFYEWAINHGYNDKLTIKRDNVNGNYCPENCKWILPDKQYLNRTDSHFVTAFGKTQTIKEWSDETGIKYGTIERRINAYHWPAERAVSEPPRHKQKN